MNDYNSELSFIEGSDDSLFPDWLFNPYFNEFDDDFYEQSFASDKLTTDAKKLKRRYNDFFEWDKAMTVYDAYMEKMIEKYGSMKIIKNSIEYETMPDFIPAKPKLKNNSKNRSFLKLGIVPSMKINDISVDDDELFAVARQIFPNQMGEDIDPSKMTDKMSKEQKRSFEKMMDDADRKYRRANMYRSVGNSRGTDFIVEYLNQVKRGVYNSSGYKVKEDDDQNFSLVERAKELERIRDTPQWILDDEASPTTIMVNGRLVNRKQQEAMDVYQELYREGFDILGTLKDKMDRKSVKMIRSQIGANEPLTKKEMKELKKQNKKDQKKMMKRRDESEALNRLLLGNKLEVEFTRDENRNLTMNLNKRMRDLFPD